MARPIGLIAAGGRLPILTAHGIHAAGRKVGCVGLRGEYDPALPSLCERFRTSGLIQLGKWIRLFKRWGVTEAVMVGSTRKISMYQPLLWMRYLPDIRALRLWYVTVRDDRRTDKLLTAVVDELASEGITLMDTTRYIREHMSQPGVLTRTRPTAAQIGDIRFALPIVRRMGDLDIGQSVAVKDREILAVEAIEGTDAMIARAGTLCPARGWSLIKVAKPAQDMRFDVPTVGLTTIEQLKAAGATCLAVEADKVILLDKPQFLEAADDAGIAVIGIEPTGEVVPDLT